MSETIESCLVLVLSAEGGQGAVYTLAAALAGRCGHASLLDLSPEPLPGALPPGAQSLAVVLAEGREPAASAVPLLGEPRLRVLLGGQLGPAQILGGAVTSTCRELAHSGAVVVLAPALHAELLRELVPEATAAVFACNAGLEALAEVRRTSAALQELLPATALALLTPAEAAGLTLTPGQATEYLRPLPLYTEIIAALERILEGGAGGGSALVARERLLRLRDQDRAVGPAATSAPADPEETALLRRVVAFYQRRRRLISLRRDAEALAAELAQEAAALRDTLSL